MTSTSWKAEASLWFHLAWPLGVSNMAWIASNFISVAFLGHLGTDYLAASSIASLWLYVSSTWMQQAYAVALSALTGQALGADRPKLAGGWYQVAVALGLAFTIPIGVGWWFTEDIVQGFGFSPSVAHLAGKFARWSMLELWPVTLLQLTCAFLQAQGKVLPTTCVALFTIPMTIATNALLIHGAGHWEGLGFIGAPIAVAVTSWISLLVLFIYVVATGAMRPTWPGWNLNFFTKRRLRQFFLEQAVPASVTVALEEFQITVVSFMAAKLGSVDIAAHNALISLLMLLSGLAFGVLDATTIRVAHHLGAGNVKLAKQVSVLSFVSTVTLSAAVGLCLYLLRHDVPSLFTHDHNVASAAEDLVPLLSLAYVVFGFFFSCMAVLSGQARQTVQAVAFVIGAWCVSVPSAYFFSHTLGEGLRGLWLGLILGYGVVTSITLIAVLRTDYDTVVREAVERAAEEEAHVEGTKALIQPLDAEA